MRAINYADHLEKIVGEALQEAQIKFTHESENKVQRLDFYLPDSDVYIEVKQYDSLRTAGQLKLQNNIILLQGIEAVRLFAKLITKNQ